MSTPTVYFPNLIQIRPQYTDNLGNEPDMPENVCWLLGASSTGIAASTLKTVAQQFDVPWAAMWAEIGATGYDYIGSIATDWSSSSGVQVTTVGTTTPTSGTMGNVMAGGTSVLISWQTTSPRYRGGKPRTYLPFVGVSALTPPWLVQTSVANSTTTKANAVISTLQAIGSGEEGPYDLCLLRNRHSSSLINAWGMTSGKCQTLIATQRRRQRKVAHH